MKTVHSLEQLLVLCMRYDWDKKPVLQLRWESGSFPKDEFATRLGRWWQAQGRSTGFSVEYQEESQQITIKLN